MKRFTYLICLCLLLAAPSGAAEPEFADRLVVRKADRKLELYSGETILRTMDIALGLAPAGHKRREGDQRTPEGRYRLADRNPASDYFLSIRITYPNDEDRQSARRRGQRPGGQIMIHGQPNEPKYSPEYYRTTDWTNGCIAVSNSDMVDIWLMTRPGTPIEIRP